MMQALGSTALLDRYGHPLPPSRRAASEFEGAAYGRRLGTWGMFSSGPNSAMTSSLSALRSRTRQLTRNNPLADGAVDTLVANMVGKGITPRWNLKDRTLKEQVQELWADCVNEMDYAGVSNHYGQQAQVARTMINGGEALGLFRPRSQSLGLTVPLQMQIIEGDHLDETYSTVADNGNDIRMGIEFDRAWDRAAYHLFMEHPGETFINADNTSRRRIPARDVLHIYRPLRPGQIRGLPWLKSVIVKLNEIDQCVDAELVRRKTTAMFGGFITENAQIAGHPGYNPLGRPAGSDAKGNPIIALEPGTFPKLPIGYDVKFSTPQDVGGNYIAWMDQQLRDIARGMRCTFEQLTGNLTGVNYSSIRAGLLEFRRLIIQIIYETIVFQFCRPWVNRWMDAAVLSAALPIPVHDYLMNRRIYRRVEWMPDGWPWVNPIDDQKADMMEIRNGLTSRARKVAERGGDVEVIDKEIAEDNARADGLDLILDSDPRRTAGSGLYQETEKDED